MRGSNLIGPLAMFVLLGVSGVAAVTVVDFSPPGQVSGSSTFSSFQEFAVGEVDPSTTVRIVADERGFRGTTMETRDVRLGGGSFGSPVNGGLPVSGQRQDWNSDATAIAAVPISGQIQSIRIVGVSSGFAAISSADQVLNQFGANHCHPWQNPFDKDQQKSFRNSGCQNGEGVIAAIFGATGQVKIETARSIEFFGWDFTCTPDTYCPTKSGSFPDYQTPDGGAHLETRRWVRIEATASSIDFFLTNTDIALGGPTFDVNVSGVARLPDAQFSSCSGPCSHDYTGATLVSTGTLAANELRRTDAGRVEGVWTVNDSTTRLDETYVDPDSLFGMRAATAGSVAAIAVLAKLLVGLFTKIGADKALEHPRRQALQGYITENPGATFRELLRGTNIPAGTARHHLTIMRRSGLIVEKQHRSTLRFFENHGKFDETWAAVVLLREPDLKSLHDWIRENPHSKQTSILDAMIENGWTRSTTQHRLERLVKGGIVTFRPQGRLKLYEAHEKPVISDFGGWR